MLTLFGERVFFDDQFPNVKNLRRRRRDHRPTSWLVVPNGCWMWEGPTAKDGYPKTGINGRTLAAHRWMYERLVGPIPEGMTLDHLCRHVACVNPKHLEPCLNIENIARGTAHRRAMKELLY